MGSSPVVLVVEDEWFLRDCIAAHLRAARWHVIEARSGEAAIELLKERRHVDVLFTDIQLGGAVDGWDVGVTFRKVLPEIPVIYTSGCARSRWPVTRGHRTAAESRCDSSLDSPP
jgi:CheY-like chemotaxis protein